MVDFVAPSVVYGLALFTAVLWGFEPIVSKRAMSFGGSPLQASLVVVVVDSTLYWLALVLLGEVDVFFTLSAVEIGLFLLAGLLGTAFGRILFFSGIQRVGASINSAVVSARPLFATALAVAFLGERMTTTMLGGVVVLVVGLSVLALARGGDIRGWKKRDLLFPLAGALVFAAGNVLRRYGLTVSPASALGAVTLNEMAALAGLVAYALVRGRTDVLRAPRKTYALFAVSGTITAVALLALFAVLSLPDGRIVVVDPLVSLAPLFTAVFAYLFLNDLERVTRGIVAGATLVVVGAALVTLA